MKYLYVYYKFDVFLAGRFGTGVLSYFVFLRWLFYVNILVCLLVVAFLFVPQMLLEQSVNDNTVSFTGKELITGEVSTDFEFI